jgi:6-methylsalicylate decarboxylase
MGLSRRSFLGAASAATVPALGRFSATAAAAAPRGYRETRRVDMHAHYLAPAYLQALKDRDITTLSRLPIPAWTPELALKFMDDHGIAVQMLSLSDPGVRFVEDPAQALALARACNDYVAGVAHDHPKRFGALAFLPLADVAAATAEAIRALDTLHHDGVGLLSNEGGRYLGDPIFAPLLAELDRRKAWVFVHPAAVGDDDRPSYSIPDFVCEFPFDTARTIVSLMFNGAFDKYPHIRWHFAHGGGAVPMLRSRLTALAGNAKAFGSFIGLPSGARVLTATSAEKLLAAQHYDTALIADAPELHALKAMAPARRILFGSDWPFAARLFGAKGDPQPALSATFTAADRHAIDRLNARRAFPRVARAVTAAH